VLSAKMDGMETLSWMDASGVMLRQQTPFGWTLESSTAQDALSPANTTDTGDLLTALAVPITGNADLLTSRPAVRLRLTGVTLTREQLETHRQEIVALGPHSAEIIVKADALPPLRRPVAQPHLIWRPGWPPPPSSRHRTGAWWKRRGIL